jgi:hypothetical protein
MKISLGDGGFRPKAAGGGYAISTDRLIRVHNYGNRCDGTQHHL